MLQPELYSWIRFSSPEQEHGDSERRQEDGLAALAERKGLPVNRSLKTRRGESAWSGDPLADFLDLVRAGKVAPGSILAAENIDRFWRKNPWKAMADLCQIVNAGIRVITLRPEFEYHKDNPWALMMAVPEMVRANGESEHKSTRVGDAWSQKRKRAQTGQVQQQTKHVPAGQSFMTQKLPCWIRVVDGKLALHEDKAQSIRLIFQLASQGYGTHNTIDYLTKHQIPPITKAGRWTRSFVSALIRDRRLLGELQPKSHNKDSGPVIMNYFPAVITEEEWLQARAGARERKVHRGRTAAKGVNLWAGLMKSALDGSSMYAGGRVDHKGQLYPVLVNVSAAEGTAPIMSFPQDVFDECMCKELYEVDWKELLQPSQQPNRVDGLRRAFESAKAELDELVDACRGKSSRTLAMLIDEKEQSLERIKTELAEEQLRSANPIEHCWENCKEALALGLKDPDSRLKIQTALRKVIASMHLLVVPIYSTRPRQKRKTKSGKQGPPLAMAHVLVCQVFFKGPEETAGGHRTLTIIRKRGSFHRPAEIVSQSFRMELDQEQSLRDPVYARQLAERIGKAPADWLND